VVFALDQIAIVQQLVAGARDVQLTSPDGSAYDAARWISPRWCRSVLA